MVEVFHNNFSDRFIVVEFLDHSVGREERTLQYFDLAELFAFGAQLLVVFVIEVLGFGVVFVTGLLFLGLLGGGFRGRVQVEVELFQGFHDSGVMCPSPS